jgi:hypothetical protein
MSFIVTVYANQRRNRLLSQESIEMARTADQAKPRKGKGVVKRVAKKSVMKIKSDSAKIKKVAGEKMKAPKVPFLLPSFSALSLCFPTCFPHIRSHFDVCDFLIFRVCNVQKQAPVKKPKTAKGPSYTSRKGTPTLCTVKVSSSPSPLGHSQSLSILYANIGLANALRNIIVSLSQYAAYLLCKPRR